MKTALVLSYWNLNRCVSGGVRRIHGLLSALGPGVLLCQPGAAHPLYRTISYRRDFGRRKVLFNWGMFNFLWPANTRLVRHLVAQHDPSLIVLTSMWNYFPLTDTADVPIVLDAHDVNAVAVGERYGQTHPFSRLVQAWERRTIHRMNHVFACSPVDAESFRRLYGLPPDRVSVVPNGVNVSCFDALDAPLNMAPAIEAQLQGTTVLFFMGKLSYQPNREALRFLNDVLMPALERSRPGAFSLLVCGGPVPDAKDYPALIFAGQLPDDDLRRHLQRSDICLAPIMTGSGTRLKILEYMAAGKPVVATPKGAEGIDCEPGRDLIVSKPETFAGDLMALAADRSAMRRVAAAGNHVVRAKYDWESSIAPLWRGVCGRWLD